jgi:chitinase
MTMESSRHSRSRGGSALRSLAAIALLTGALAAGADAAAQAPSGGDAKRVVAYWADWEYWADSSFTHDNVDFSRLTHVNYAFAWNDEAGTIYFTDEVVFDGLGAKSFSGGPGEGPVKCSPPFWHPFSQYDASRHPAVCRRWNDHVSGFTKSVHDDGAKAILSVGGWTLSHRVSEMLASPAARAAFVDNAVAILEDWGFDGLDLDFEFPGYAPHGGRPIDKANYTLLLEALRQRFDQVETATGRHLELTAAVSCGPQIANAAYDYPAVSALLDYVNLLAYDFGGDWDPVAQHMSPLFPYAGEVNAGFDADSCRKFWTTTGTAPAAKVVLGMAHYGRSFRGATAIGDPSGGHDSAHWGGDTETRYYQIVDRKQNDPTFHTDYDPVARTHRGWFDGGGFISFEDTASIGERARYVVDHGLAGVMIWQLRGGMLREGGGYRYPLLDAALEAFGASPPAEPGSDGDPDAGECAPYVQPYAGDSPYVVGDKVSFAGKGYVSTFAPNWWSPSMAPSFWAETSCSEPGDEGGGTDGGGVSDGSGDGDGGGAPADDAACAEFVQPFAGDPAYQIGDTVLFQGKAYVSTFAPNWWSPAAAPAYWRETTCAGSGAGG